MENRNPRELLELLDQYSALIQCIIPIYGAIDWPSGQLCDQLADAIEWMPEAFAEAVEMPEFVRIKTLDEDDTDFLCEWLFDNGKLGYLVIFTYPQHDYTNVDGSMGALVHTGITQSCLLYGDTVDDAIESGIVWLKAQDDIARAKAASADSSALEAPRG